MKRPLTGQILSIIILFFFYSCQTPSKENKIILKNTSAVALTDNAISIQRSSIPDIPEGELLPLIVSTNGDTIAAQLDDLNGDKSWDELFFVADLPANDTTSYSLAWISSQPDVPVRTSARFGKRASAEAPVKPATAETLSANELPMSLGYQRYQTDGPSWENDKVGFRHYLDGRNSKDVFGKKVSAISPEDVGINADGAVEDDYHEMADWGRDILSVGNSVGLGGYGLKSDDQLFRLGVTVNDSVNNVEETSFQIVTEGPVRSVLAYQYSNWNPADRSYGVEEHTAIWPGMYGYQNEVEFSGLQGDEELVVGLVNINTDEPLTQIDENDTYVVLYTHDKQTYEKEWWLGMALIIPRDVYLGFTEAPETGPLSNTFLARLAIENDAPVEYYAVACWELSDEGFSDEEYFLNYLKDLTNQLSSEVEITVN
jgi:hypothetical protein